MNDTSHSLSGTVLVYVFSNLLLFTFLMWHELVLARSVKNLLHTVISLVDLPL